MTTARTILLLLVLAAAGPAAARVWHVPTAAPDIQSGLNAAQPGDTVQVAPGIYTEADIQMAAGVVLRGEPDLPGAVTIDAAYAGRVITCRDLTSASVIEGFTMIRGLASDAAGMLLEHANTTVRRCIFRDNLAGFDGGAIVCDESTGLIEECEFVTNVAGGGSGGAITSRRAAPTIRGCSFRGNDSLGWGGAIYISGVDAAVVVEKCEFLDNSATLGGALAVSGAAPTVGNSEFRRNRADSSGGAFYLSLGADVTISDSRFEANYAPTGKIGTVGGGCSALLRCTDADPSSVAGAGEILWDDAECAGVAAETLSWSRLKTMYR